MGKTIIGENVEVFDLGSGINGKTQMGSSLVGEKVECLNSLMNVVNSSESMVVEKQCHDKRVARLKLKRKRRKEKLKALKRYLAVEIFSLNNEPSGKKAPCTKVKSKHLEENFGAATDINGSSAVETSLNKSIRKCNGLEPMVVEERYDDKKVVRVQLKRKRRKEKLRALKRCLATKISSVNDESSGKGDSCPEVETKVLEDDFDAVGDINGSIVVETSLTQEKVDCLNKYIRKRNGHEPVVVEEQCDDKKVARIRLKRKLKRKRRKEKLKSGNWASCPEVESKVLEEVFNAAGYINSGSIVKTSLIKEKADCLNKYVRKRNGHELVVVEEQCDDKKVARIRLKRKLKRKRRKEKLKSGNWASCPEVESKVLEEVFNAAGDINSGSIVKTSLIEEKADYLNKNIRKRNGHEPVVVEEQCDDKKMARIRLKRKLKRKRRKEKLKSGNWASYPEMESKVLEEVFNAAGDINSGSIVKTSLIEEKANCLNKYIRKRNGHEPVVVEEQCDDKKVARIRLKRKLKRKRRKEKLKSANWASCPEVESKVLEEVFNAAGDINSGSIVKTSLIEEKTDCLNKYIRKCNGHEPVVVEEQCDDKKVARIRLKRKLKRKRRKEKLKSPKRYLAAEISSVNNKSSGEEVSCPEVESKVLVEVFDAASDINGNFAMEPSLIEVKADCLNKSFKKGVDHKPMVVEEQCDYKKVARMRLKRKRRKEKLKALKRHLAAKISSMNNVSSSEWASCPEAESKVFVEVIDASGGINGNYAVETSLIEEKADCLNEYIRKCNDHNPMVIEEQYDDKKVVRLRLKRKRRKEKLKALKRYFAAEISSVNNESSGEGVPCLEAESKVLEKLFDVAGDINGGSPVEASLIKEKVDCLNKSIRKGNGHEPMVIEEQCDDEKVSRMQLEIKGKKEIEKALKKDSSAKISSVNNESSSLGGLIPEMESKVLVEEESVSLDMISSSYVDVEPCGNEALIKPIKEDSVCQSLSVSLERPAIQRSSKKLLILDVNGLLADIVPYNPYGSSPDTVISMKSVFKRPYCDDFLEFCFDRFNVGIWSSRTRRNLDMVIDFLMRDSKHKLLFCWDQSNCTKTGFTTVENRDKPLVLKELSNLWENFDETLPWNKGEYDESNTLLLDDSPYKALCNPAHTGIFPYSYDHRDRRDSSLGPGGDLRMYLERLADAENVQKFVVENPHGQGAITESNASWGFYQKIIKAVTPPVMDSFYGKHYSRKEKQNPAGGNTEGNTEA